MKNARRQLLMALWLAPLCARAQQQPARIAWLGSGTARGSTVLVDAFKQGMRENGFVEGKHYAIDIRYAEGHYDRFPALIQDLLVRKPDLIVAHTIASVRAAQNATKTVPIIMAAINDPVGSGLITSLASPGGNTTGLGTAAEDVAPKYVELVRELLPGARRLAILVNGANPTNLTMLSNITAAARSHDLATRPVEVMSPEAITGAFATAAHDKPDAIAIVRDSMFLDEIARIGELGLRMRIATFGPTPEYADAGCLVGFGTSIREMFRRAATPVSKVLRGSKPADLPVELPTHFETVLNARTAKALGVSVPQPFLLRVNRVIE